MGLFGSKKKELRCPICHSRNIRRSTRRGILEKEVLPYFNAYPYRCRDCSNRFFEHFRDHEDVISETRQIPKDAMANFKD